MAHDIFFICNKMNNSSALAVIIGIKKFEHFSMLLYFFFKKPTIEVLAY